MATLSAASRRGTTGGGNAGGVGETGGGSGTGSILQKLKMAILKEEELAGESVSEVQETMKTETMKNGHKSCDARSDSGFSDCPSIVSPTATLVRLSECPSAISEKTPPVSDQDRSPPPPTRGSSSLATCRPSSPVSRRPSSPASRHPSSPASRHFSSPASRRPLSPTSRRPSSPASRRPSSPASLRSSSAATRPFSPTTRGSSSPATRGPSSPATRGPSSLTTRSPSSPTTRGPSPLVTNARSPLPRNHRDATHLVHNVPLSTGTGVSGICETNRLIFDNGRRDSNGSPVIIIGGGGVQRKEPIRKPTAENFKKTIAFWKQ